MTFSTPVSPTRDSDMRTDGGAPWTSTGSQDDRLGSMASRRTLAVKPASSTSWSTTGCPHTPASRRSEAPPQARRPRPDWRPLTTRRDEQVRAVTPYDLVHDGPPPSAA